MKAETAQKRKSMLRFVNRHRFYAVMLVSYIVTYTLST